jgi:hypothetical protein
VTPPAVSDFRPRQRAYHVVVHFLPTAAGSEQVSACIDQRGQPVDARVPPPRDERHAWSADKLFSGHVVVCLTLGTPARPASRLRAAPVAEQVALTSQPRRRGFRCTRRRHNPAGRSASPIRQVSSHSAIGDRRPNAPSLTSLVSSPVLPAREKARVCLSGRRHHKIDPAPLLSRWMCATS